MVVLRMYLENFNLTLVAVDSNNVPRKVPAFDGKGKKPSKSRHISCLFYSGGFDTEMKRQAIEASCEDIFPEENKWPKIRFERMGKMGGGDNFCDFHFIHGN